MSTTIRRQEEGAFTLAVALAVVLESRALPLGLVNPVDRSPISVVPRGVSKRAERLET